MGHEADRVVRVAGLACAGRHGAYPGERDVARIFLVDVAARGRSDERDVERIATTARAAIARGSHALLERVAWEVAGELLDAIATIDEVEVRVVKPDPPGLDATAEAVSLTRSRAGRVPRASSAPPEGQEGRHGPE